MSVNNPMSMKLSASWEIEKSSPNVVPRICSLSITQVIIDRPIEAETHNAFFVAVRMRDSPRRVIRSPEILLSENVGAVPLDLSCSIQYSHMLKRDSNILQLLVQRRKKYKSKTMNLGYKTLAYCNIDLAQVLQKRIENKYLELYTNAKDTANSIGRIEIQSLSTLPVEKSSSIFNGRRKDLEEEDEVMQDVYSEQEDSDHGEDSDFEPMEDDGQSRQKKIIKAMSLGVPAIRRPSSPTTPVPEWQKQIKQKIVGLLKKMKFLDPNEELDPTTTSQLWEEIDQMETVSDGESDENLDTLSVQSTPRPALRPFFGHTGGSEDTLHADTGKSLVKKLRENRYPDLNILDYQQSRHSTYHPGDYYYNNAVDFQESSEENSHSNDSGGGGASGQLAPLPGTATKPSKRSSSAAAHHSQKTSRERSTSLREKKRASHPQHNAERSTGAEKNAPSQPVSGPTSLVTGTANLSGNAPGPPQSSQVNKTPIIENRTNLNEQASPSRRPRSSSIPDSRGELAAINNGRWRLFSFNNMPGIEPRHETQEQVNRFIDSEDTVPPAVFLIHLGEHGTKNVAECLLQSNYKVITTASYTDTRFAVTHLVNKAQKQGRLSNLIKICLLGGDSHVNGVLRVYCEQLTSKSSEMGSHFRFFLVPLPCLNALNISPNNSTPSSSTHTSNSNNAFAGNMLARQLCQMDPQYASLFGDVLRSHWLSAGSPSSSVNQWLQSIGAASCLPLNTCSMADYLSDLVRRIDTYLNTAQHVVQFPIGECLVASKNKGISKGGDDDAGEAFVPFVSGVRLGEVDPSTNPITSSAEQDEAPCSERNASANVSSITPPHSPNLSSPTAHNSQLQAQNSGNLSNAAAASSSCGSGQPTTTPSTRDNADVHKAPGNAFNSTAGSSVGGGLPDSLLDLQIEYWLEGSDRKSNLKSSVFRGVAISLGAPTTKNISEMHFSQTDSILLNMIVVTKEKKQKIMRIGKKSKDIESRREVVDNISRLICTSRNQGAPMKIVIDGVEWPGTKFFQLSPFWRTHVKLFPFAIFNPHVFR